MKLKTSLILFLIALALPANARARNVESYEEMITNLRFELIEVQAKEADLQIRLEQLDVDLKPENIEHALAGIGSTRPEELREQRRRLLNIERDGVVARLKLVEKSRVRLEAAIATAEAAASQQSAQPSSVTSKQRVKVSGTIGSRWLLPPVSDCNAVINRGNEPGAKDPVLGQEASSSPSKIECRASDLLMP